MKLLFVLLAGVAIGYGLGKIKPTLPVAPSHREWSQKGFEKIQRLSDPDLKLKEAEAYYGKAVVLLLASLVAKPLVTTPTSQPDIESSLASSLSPEKTSIPAPVTSKVSPDDKKASKLEQDTQRLVAYRQSPTATKLTPQMKRLIGVFEGTYTHLSGKNKGRIDRIDMDLQLEMNGREFSGQTRITFTDPDGKIYSNSTGSGSNQTLKSMTEDHSKIYVQTSPGEFMLIDVSHRSNLRGEFFDAGGSLQGPVVLWRK